MDNDTSNNNQNNQNTPTSNQPNPSLQPAEEVTPPGNPVAPTANPLPPAPPAVEAAAPTSVTSDWPGAFKIFKISKAAVMLNLGTIIGIYLITFVLSTIFTVLTRNMKLSAVAILFRIILEVVEVVIAAGMIYATIQGVRGKKISIGDSLAYAFKKTLYIVVVYILLALILFVSLLLLIVPFFFVLPRVYLSIYYVLDKDLDPIESIKASWEATKDHSGKFWGIVGVYILIVLPVITIIGILATIYFGLMYAAAYAVLYEYITQHKSTPAVPASQ